MRCKSKDNKDDENGDAITNVLDSYIFRLLDF